MASFTEMLVYKIFTYSDRICISFSSFFLLQIPSCVVAVCFYVCSFNRIEKGRLKPVKFIVTIFRNLENRSQRRLLFVYLS